MGASLDGEARYRAADPRRDWIVKGEEGYVRKIGVRSTGAGRG